MHDMALFEARLKVERADNWREIADQIPTLKFPSEWEVKIVPPFGGAVARFFVYKEEVMVSVYLDFNDRLGYMQEPYWELYPNPEQDCDRFLLNDTESLMQGIEAALASLISEKKQEPKDA